MTIKEARKILGLRAKNLSDVQIEEFIVGAELLKNIFFDYLKQAKVYGQEKK